MSIFQELISLCTLFAEEPKILLELLSGKVNVSFTRRLGKGEVFTIKTPTNVVGVRGTQYQLEIKEEQTHTKVYESTVYVYEEESEKRIDIQAGQKSIDVSDPVEIPEEELREMRDQFEKENILLRIKDFNPGFYENHQLNILFFPKGGIRNFEINKKEKGKNKISYKLITQFNFLEEYQKLHTLILRNIADINSFIFLKTFTQLKYLSLSNLKITDRDLMLLSPSLSLETVNLSDLKNLKSIKFISKFKTIKTLGLMRNKQLKDLSPLKGLNVRVFNFARDDVNRFKNISVLRNMKSIVKIVVTSEELTVEDFWKKYDSGGFNK